MERACSAWFKEESWLRRSVWRESTSERSWFSKRRMAWWRRSAVEAGEPEESAAEEKEVEENDGERKAERIGSLANTSNGEDELAVVVAVTVDVADVAFTGDEIVGFFKLARRWKGEETAAGEAIYFFFWLLLLRFGRVSVKLVFYLYVASFSVLFGLWAVGTWAIVGSVRCTF